MKKYFILITTLILTGCFIQTQAVDLPDLPQNKANTLEQTQKAFAQVQPQQSAQQTVNLYDFGTTYDKAIKSNKPVVLLFYTNWCSACKRVLPLVKDQQAKFSNDYIFTSLNAEDTNYADVIKSYRLRCFPTVYIIDPKYDNRVHIEVSYLFNADAFSQELNRYLNIRKILDKK